MDSLDGKVLKDTRRDTCKLTNKIFSLHYSDKLVNKDSMSSSAKVHIVSNHK